MGVITVSIDDEVEKDLRNSIEDKKGALGEAISEAVKDWIGENKSEKAKEDLKKMIDEGYELGEIQYEHRSELHDRWEKNSD